MPETIVHLGSEDNLGEVGAVGQTSRLAAVNKNRDKGETNMYEEAVTMWNDERPIKGLTMISGGDRWWEVGSGGVTRIELYREGRQGGTVVPCRTGGQGDAAIWFAVYQGDWLAYRANGALIEHVWYGKVSEE